MNRCILLLVMALNMPAFAQDMGPEIPPPQAPFYNTPPAGSQWSINIAPIHTGAVADKSKETTEVRMQVCVGKNQLIKGIVSYSNKEDKLYYVVGNYFVEENSSLGKVVILPTRINPLLQQPFSGVRGLSLQSYLGVEVIEKEPCYKYKVAEKDAEGRVFSVVTTWIRVADGYPRRVQLADQTLNFSVVAPFSDSILLPPNYTEALKKLNAEQQAMELMRKRNGL